MSGIASGSLEPALPSLRQELRLERGAPLVNGAPSWTLFDPVRHMFFQLGRIEFQIFSHWARGSFEGLAEALKADGVSDDEVNAEVGRVIEFSLSHHLTQSPLGDSVATFKIERDRARKAWWKWLIDNYLFFRLPLVRPARFLERTLPKVAPLWSSLVLTIFATLALSGLLLVSRQWDAFLASFAYFFSWNGLLAYALGLSVVKIAHELGHAYTATRFGVRVPSMGVSFLVMFPVLYTDTTGAWRLRSRRQRLAIDCAGVAAELMIASIATILWVLLPEGVVRSAVFVLATTSWVMSLAVNLNPFMRFDGYYLLADLIDVPNLQSRAFALGQWKMRELLFGLGEEAPEQVPRRMQTGMILYAWMTWLYRLVLFIGIALLVYFMFFKALGILLFMVEIGVFVARPIWMEMRQWNARRDAIMASTRGKKLLVLLGAVFVLTLLPLDRRVNAPAILAPVKAAPIVAGDPARIDKIMVRNGEMVRAGTVLFELSAPELETGRTQSGLRISELESRLARAAADGEDLANRAILERELASERAAAQGIERRRSRLIIRAPLDGMIVDLDAAVHSGRWVNGAEALARVVSPTQFDVQAYVDEDDVWRVASGAAATFVPDDPVRASHDVRLVERAAAAVQRLDQPMLASTNGGPIAVNEDKDKQLRPRGALYRLRFVANSVPQSGRTLVQPVMGRAIIAAEPTSLLGQLVRLMTQTIRKEGSLT